LILARLCPSPLWARGAYGAPWPTSSFKGPIFRQGGKGRKERKRKEWERKRRSCMGEIVQF